MKKVFVLIAPLFIAIIIFASVTYFLNKNSGKGALQVTSFPQSNVYLNGRLIGKNTFLYGNRKVPNTRYASNWRVFHQACPT